MTVSKSLEQEEQLALRFTTSYLADSVDLLRYYKALAERAMAQVSNEQLLILLHEDMNSIAVIVKHIAIANSTTRPPLAKRCLPPGSEVGIVCSPRSNLLRSMICSAR